MCFTRACVNPQCYGYPMVSRPSSCCPECDFNVSATECGVVPLGTTYVEVPVEGGGGVCRETVLSSGCDKSYVVEGEDWYSCDSVRENVTLSLEELSSQPGKVGVGGCDSAVTYESVTRCDKRRLSSHEIPQDYDPNPDRCSFVVEDGAIVMTTGTTIEASGTKQEGVTDFISSDAPPIAMPPVVSLIACAILLFCPVGD